jgi:hypothetical protein
MRHGFSMLRVIASEACISVNVNFYRTSYRLQPLNFLENEKRFVNLLHE